jgi:hypothetical protein
MDELENELTRLFQDDRLDMRVADGAEQTIVRGARRVRRRRIALTTTAGVLAVAVVVGGGVVVAGLGGDGPTEAAHDGAQITVTSSTTPTSVPSQQPPPVEPTGDQTAKPPQSGGPGNTPPPPRATTTTPPRTTAGLPVSSTVLGPDGYSKIKLGMTYDQAVATGMLASKGDPPGDAGCVGPLSTNNKVMVAISKASGVVGIFAQTTDVSTPDGIRLGSTLAQVNAAYPKATQDAKGDWIVPTTGRARFQIGVSASMQAVTELSVSLNVQDC